MKKASGLRKLIICTEGLVAFVFLVMGMGLRDAASIIAVGTSLTALIGAAIYGNIQEHRITREYEVE